MPTAEPGESGSVGKAKPLAKNTPSHTFDTAIVWFRRDLRVDDNPALVAAVRNCRNVVPVYVFAPEEEGQFQPGKCSRWWLKGALAALNADLELLGSSLILRCGTESEAVLLKLVEETGATALFYNHLYDPISLVRDNEVKTALTEKGVSCYSFNSELLYEPWEVVDENGRAFTTFADFWNKVVHMPYPPQPVLAVPPYLPLVHARTLSLTLDEMGLVSEEEEMSSDHLRFKWTPGSFGATKTLQDFLGNRLRQFDMDRAKTDRDSTSRLSPHIHFGEISVRRIHYMVKQLEWEWATAGNSNTSCSDYLRQVGYREYGRYLSFHFPFTHERSLLEHLRACPWNFDQSMFKAWRQGATGYPLVDAGMLELWSTGWLHNRLRVVCASFLVKNLLLPWQWGLKHFWDTLLDADIESDVLGFQYVSGCLLDAHPFSYMHDLEAESRRFDPSGNYVRKWLPSLARMPLKYIHCPSNAPPKVLSDAGVELGINYPYPVVTPEESAQRVEYACEVIASCCPAPPKYKEEPYYPPSDPCLASDAVCRPWSSSLPGVSRHMYGQYTEMCAGSEDVGSNILGMSVARTAVESSAISSFRDDFVEQAEDDADGGSGSSEQQNLGNSDCKNNTGTGTSGGTGTQLRGGDSVNRDNSDSRCRSPQPATMPSKRHCADSDERTGETVNHEQEG